MPGGNRSYPFLLLILLGWFFSIDSHAQKLSNRMDNYLMLDYYDGSKFLGHMINDFGNSIWKIKIATGDTISVNPQLASNVLSAQSALIFKKRKYHLLKGTYFFITQSFRGGTNFSTQIDFTAAKTLNTRWSVGAGLGFSTHEFLDLTGFLEFRSFTNFYSYGRYYINHGKLRWFTDLKAGFAVASNTWDEQYSGGAYIQPGIGVTLTSRKKFKWQFGLSQYLLNSSGEDSGFDNFGNPIFQEYNIWFNRTMFSIGFVYTIPAQPFKKR